MPRSAVASAPTETTTTPLDELLDQGRSRGRLSLEEVRRTFHEAGITPDQGRSILRELSDAGVRLAGDDNSHSKTMSGVKGPGTKDGAKNRTENNAKTPAKHGAKTGRRATTTKRTTTKQTEQSENIDNKGNRAPSPDDVAPVFAPALDTDSSTDTSLVIDSDLDVDIDEIDATNDLDDHSSVMGDSVHTYLKAIGKRPLLTAAQEVELAKRIEAGLYAEYKLENDTDLDDESRNDEFRAELMAIAEDGVKAKAHMLEANLRLVVSVAKKYSDRGLSLLDVVQEGNLGLIRAVEKFDYTKGYKFSTYAMWWIRQAIQRGFADSARTIRLPVHVLEMLTKLSRVERDMHQRLGREPTPEELAEELGKSPSQVRELLRTSRQPISLDSTIGEDGETRIGDLIEDTDSPEAAEVVDRQLMAEQLRQALSVLSAREEKIMAMRFGLYDGTPRTLDEIGKHLGLTRERIRQLEKESLSKLRHPSNAQSLLDFAS